MRPRLIGRSTVLGVSAPTWESLGEPEWKVEEWKQWGFEPDHILRWRDKLKKAIAEHNKALRKMLPASGRASVRAMPLVLSLPREERQAKVLIRFRSASP
jgi:hypothetical protein